MLWTLILIPLITAACVPLVAKRTVWKLAMLGTLAALAATAYVFASHGWFDPRHSEAAQFDSTLDWSGLPGLGVKLSLGIDGVTLLLVGLTALLGPICVAGSVSAITTRVRTYYGWLLVLQAAMTGVFLARDAILFYVFFEFTLVPMFVLISLFGSTNRKHAAVKFFLYTFTGSVITLAGVVFVAFQHAKLTGEWSFKLSDLISTGQSMPAATQAWVFGALMLGFCIKVPLFPLHTWLPLAHTEAPTAGSVILAGVLLKLGTYGIFAIVIPMVPAAALSYAPAMATLAIAGILVGGLICWVQEDIKKLVAYSSVAHLGFCVLGMFSFNAAGFQGAVLYMINHGLSTGALFLLIGMMYERYHTRDLKQIGGLARRMPIWATFMVFFSMASVGLPGLNGFVSEFLCIMGAFQAGDAWRVGREVGGAGVGLGPWYAAVAATGMIVAAIYMLSMLGRGVWGALREPPGHHSHNASHGHDQPSPAAPATNHADAAEHAHHLPADLTRREIGILVPLAAFCLFLGVYPKPAMDMITPVVTKRTELFQSVAASRSRSDSPKPQAATPSGSAPMDGLLWTPAPDFGGAR